MTKISIIVAIAENRAIGKKNDLIVHLSNDLKHFKEVTTGKCVVMGHNTWLSLPGQKALPKRRNVIISDRLDKAPEGFEFGQFDDRWQRFVYPYCLTEQGYEVNMFEFHMLKWKGGTDTNPILSGDFYVESYNYKHDAARMRLRAFIERFVEFIELNRGEITDSRIFNNVQDKYGTHSQSSPWLSASYLQYYSNTNIILKQ